MLCLTTDPETESQVMKNWALWNMSQMFNPSLRRAQAFVITSSCFVITVVVTTVLLLQKDSMTNFWRNYKINSFLAFFLFNHVASEITFLMQNDCDIFMIDSFYKKFFIFILGVWVFFACVCACVTSICLVPSEPRRTKDCTVTQICLSELSTSLWWIHLNSSCSVSV